MIEFTDLFHILVTRQKFVLLYLNQRTKIILQLRKKYSSYQTFSLKHNWFWNFTDMTEFATSCRFNFSAKIVLSHLNQHTFNNNSLRLVFHSVAKAGIQKSIALLRQYCKWHLVCLFIHSLGTWKADFTSQMTLARGSWSRVGKQTDGQTYEGTQIG